MAGKKKEKEIRTNAVRRSSQKLHHKLEKK